MTGFYSIFKNVKPMNKYMLVFGANCLKATKCMLNRHMLTLQETWSEKLWLRRHFVNSGQVSIYLFIYIYLYVCICNYIYINYICGSSTSLKLGHLVMILGDNHPSFCEFASVMAARASFSSSGASKNRGLRSDDVIVLWDTMDEYHVWRAQTYCLFGRNWLNHQLFQ